jgi:hypothetical protein
MMLNSKKCGFLVGALIGAVGIVTVQAQSSIVTFSVNMASNIANGTFNSSTDTVEVAGTFNGWAPSDLVQEGASTIYTNTYNDTSDANGGVMSYKFVSSNPAYANTAGYEPTADGDNRAARLPATSGGSLVLPTPFFADLGAPVTNNVTFQIDMSQQIHLGVFTNGVNTVTVAGTFNGWDTTLDVLTNNPTIVITNGGTPTTNVYVGAFPVGGSPWSAQDFKFLIQPQAIWEAVAVTNQSNQGNPPENRFFASNPTQSVTLPLVDFSDVPYEPLSQVTFSVDMSAQLQFGYWAPTNGVFCQGINGDWNNAYPNIMSNTNATATNIYYVTLSIGEGSLSYYKFTYNQYTNGVLGGVLYEAPASTGGNNRTYTVPSATNATVPTVYFSDQAPNDFLSTTTMVTFTVNMTNAVEYGTTNAFTNDFGGEVFINGSWIDWNAVNGGWGEENLLFPTSYQLTNNPIGSYVYQGVFPVLSGSPLDVVYEYGIDGEPNEAGFGTNHVRYIRSTATGKYSFPMDTFGNMYGEPTFGQLAVGSASSGTVPLKWLGAPNVQVQTTSNLTNSVWVTHHETSGTNWTAGTYGTNGLVSATNWPVSSGQTLFFRLLKQ